MSSRHRLKLPVDPVLHQGESVDSNHQTNKVPAHAPDQKSSLLKKAGLALTVAGVAIFGGRQLWRGYQRLQWSRASEAAKAKELLENLEKQAELSVNGRPLEYMNRAQRLAVEQANSEAFLHGRKWVPGYDADIVIEDFTLAGSVPQDELHRQQLVQLVNLCRDAAKQATEEIAKQVEERGIKPVKKPEPEDGWGWSGEFESRADAGGLSLQNGLDKVNGLIGSLEKVGRGSQQQHGSFASIGSALSGAHLSPALP
ncbi:MAG: hypothetical protein M1816_001982 [Peltula sp. TS41687]|nr:MAG: hypothetical protein M1816_001982 [Peltula sp. TS41687]